MKKGLKIIGGIFLVLISLFFTLALLLYLPPFQNWAVKQVASHASEKTGMEITVERVNLAFPLNLSVKGVKVIQQNDSLPQVKDTIADVKKIIVNVQLLPLFCGKAEIDELNIQSVKFNTGSFISSARVKGYADNLTLISHGIDLSKQNVILNKVLLHDADLDVQLSDTAKEDTAKTENFWKINLKQLQLKNTKVAVHMPGDTLSVGIDIAKADAKDGNFDLFKGLYQIGTVNAAFRKINYDNNFEPFTKGLDYNHICLTDASFGLDTLSYQSPDLYLKIRSAKMKEASGLQLNQLAGIVRMDSTTLYIPTMTAETPNTHIRTSVTMDLNAFSDVNPGKIALKADAKIGKEDILLLASAMPEKLKTAWPHYPLDLNIDVEGSVKRMNVNSIKAELPTAFKASASGYMMNVMDTDHLFANLDIDATSYNLNFATRSFLDPSLAKTVRVPSGIRLKGKINADGSVYGTNLRASYGGGWLTVNGRCNIKNMTYKARINAHRMQIRKFLPTMKMSPFTGHINIDGSGTDIFSKSMRLHANAEIEKFTYDTYDLSHTKATAAISKGVVHSAINCNNKLLKADIALNALMSKKDLNATLTCDLDKADLHGMKLSDSPLTTSLCTHVDIASDLEDFYKVQGFVSDVVTQDSASTIHTPEMHINALTKRDTTWAKVNSGDFMLNMSASGGYKSIMMFTDNLMKELNRQISRKYISQDSLKQVLPIGHITLQSGKNNFVCDYAQKMGYMFREINADFTSSPISGLNGYMQVDSLIANGMQLDKIRLQVETDESGFKYSGQVKNEKNNPQYSFNALFDGSLFETGSNINLALYDENDKLGIKMGAKAMLEPNGIRIKLSDNDVILGYRDFKANADNFFYISDSNRMSAKMQLKASDGTGLQLFSNDDNTDAMQDITLGLHHLELSSITGIIPYFPDVKGVMNGDFHVIQTKEELSVSSSLGIKNLIYEGSPMGNLSSEFVYMPLDDGGHYVDGILMHNGKDIGTIKGTYETHKNDGELDADISLDDMPLYLVNGFVPDQIIGLKGYGDGTMKLKGPLSALQIDGEIDLDSAYLFSAPYGVELRFDDRPVYIKNSKLMLEDFNMYANNSQPLVINGHVDFSNISKMAIDMRMQAHNFLVIDSKENRRSEVFGKTYVNFNAVMQGPVEAIRMRGKLDVLGSTDMTYIMRDTPLTTDNRLNELVKFTSFDEKEEEAIVRPPIEGLYMDLSISVEEGARVFCALNADKSNYLDMIGGGDLRMIYSSDELRLTGRYTVNNGEMKYSLPIIPLKEFTIQEGSYVEFTGDVMNPTLNITATEVAKTNVNTDGTNRSVIFNCGVVITQTLNNMGLEFIISAPEDMTINSELQAMSKEERGKMAVTMLTTGMYLSDNNVSSFSMNDALSSFLQSEINNISNSALRTLDLSVGLDNTTDAAGTLHTDYTFKFAKRFWNNRIRIVVGGKVSSNQASAENLFDNVAFEYRLDRSANTNLRLFYDRATYDFLEGYVGQYGVGIVWKRKLQSLTELFKFKKKAQPALPSKSTEKKDSANVIKN